MIITVKLINTSIMLEDLNIQFEVQFMANEEIWYFGLMHQSVWVWLMWVSPLWSSAWVRSCFYTGKAKASDHDFYMRGPDSVLSGLSLSPPPTPNCN